MTYSSSARSKAGESLDDAMAPPARALSALTHPPAMVSSP